MRNISQYRFQTFVDSKINKHNDNIIDDTDFLKWYTKEKEKIFNEVKSGFEKLIDIKSMKIEERLKEKYKSKLSKRKSQINGYKESCEKSEQHIHKLTKEIDDCKKKISESDTLLKSKINELNTKEKQLQVYKKKNNKLKFKNIEKN